jgi:hypothetical protein
VKIEIEKRWLIGGGIAVALLFAVAIGVIALASGESGKSAAETPASDAEMAGLEEEVGSAEEEGLEECVDLWNNSENAGPQSSLAALAASYVSVTTSDLYPGKCLITAANPELNLSAQFLEGGGNPYAFDQIATGEATSLPPSVTAWNATVDSVGHIGLSSSRPARD